MELLKRLYTFFEDTQAGSVRNHLAHCVIALALQALFFALCLPLMGAQRALIVATCVPIAFYVGRSQAQTEMLWKPAKWYVSWSFWKWPWEQAGGSIYPLVSTLLVYGAARMAFIY